ncbi:MAG: hypothetical protein CM15mP120_08370 [Pseudomonadota bacterium]|nr:MAG: hypothetical protein CM15mP120_08370 [Pseudomonadota bacterium]
MAKWCCPGPLADAAHYPAIDLMGSISRLCPPFPDKDHQNLANTLRRLWTLYQQNQDLINVGAYEAGSNPDLDRAIAVRSEMENFLRPADDDRSLRRALASYRSAWLMAEMFDRQSTGGNCLRTVSKMNSPRYKSTGSSNCSAE